MRSAGFVLAGGRSARMGRDKALLAAPDSAPLVVRAAAAVAEAAGNATILGDPCRYAGLGWPVLPDIAANRGPMGGVLTALAHTGVEWNLVVACDMPGITPGLLAALLHAAGGANTLCVVPLVGGEYEPLCAVWHRDALAAVRQAVDDKRLRMRDLVASLDPLGIAGLHAGLFRNINTPEDWTSYCHCR
jgi:molybdopterin-guanine dinucleotide biosynthesis protein A